MERFKYNLNKCSAIQCTPDVNAGIKEVIRKSESMLSNVKKSTVDVDV